MDRPPIEELQARRGLYDLLARLYLRPPDETLLQALRELPGLAEHVAIAPDALEALQVEYETIFGRNVYPYESLYRDRELMLNTAVADRIARLYAACGFAAGVNEAGAPDHLGLELGLMAQLVAREVAALAGEDGAARSWARARQGQCLHEHLALWVTPCVWAIERVSTHPLYLTVARLTMELVLDDLGRVEAPGPDPLLLEAVREPPTLPPPGLTPDRELIPLRPYPDQPEGEREQGLNRVVRQLITADEVGIFFSRSDLTLIGRQLGLPVPIGERFQMLRGLFESAGQFELIAPLLDALHALVTAEASRVEAFVGAYPAWRAGADHWRTRLERGRALLEELRTQMRAPLDEPTL